MPILNSLFVVLFLFLLTMPLRKGEYSNIFFVSLLQFSLFPLIILLFVFNFQKIFEVSLETYFVDEVFLANKRLILPTLGIGALVRIYIELKERIDLD